MKAKSASDKFKTISTLGLSSKQTIYACLNNPENIHIFPVLKGSPSNQRDGQEMDNYNKVQVIYLEAFLIGS